MAGGMIGRIQIDRQNGNKRGIITRARGTRMVNLLRDEVVASDSLIVNGFSGSQECMEVLRIRLAQLYKDEITEQRPVIVIGTNLTLHENPYFENVPFYHGQEVTDPEQVYYIDFRNAYYSPFLSMSSTGVEKTVVLLAQNYCKRQVSEEEKTLFKGVCDLLRSCDFEVSLYNIMKLYGVNTAEPAKVASDRLYGLLKAGGFSREAELLQREPLYFVNMKNTIAQIYEQFSLFYERNGNGISVIQKVQEAREKGTAMPFFCFNINDGTRRAFLEYLAGELEDISKICNPIILLKDVQIGTDGENGGSFYQYIRGSSSVSLNLFSQNCMTLFPNPGEDLMNLSGTYGCKMLLFATGLNGEVLTDALGTYQHTKIGEHEEKHKGWLDLFPQGVGKGIEKHEEDWKVIRQEDISKLKRGQCYLYDRSNNVAYHYTRLIYG